MRALEQTFKASYTHPHLKSFSSLHFVQFLRSAQNIGRFIFEGIVYHMQRIYIPENLAVNFFYHLDYSQIYLSLFFPGCL